MPALTPIALEFDGGLARQPRLRAALTHTLQLPDFAAPLRLACTRARAESLKARLRDLRAAAPGPWLTFLGTGDYHHLTLALLELLPNPAATSLVLIDNHPDWFLLPPAWHCGNWVSSASRLLRSAHLVGIDSHDLAWNSCYAAPLFELATARITINPWRHASTRVPLRWTRAASASVRPRPWGTHLRFNTCLSLGIERVFADLADSLAGRDVYLSIDKDVLSPADVPSDWEQGAMTLPQLLAGIRTLRARVNLVGADVCGDRANLPLQGLLKRVDAGRLSPLAPPSDHDMARSQAANLALLDALTSPQRA